MTHTVKFRIAPGIHVGIQAGVVACLFLFGLWMSFSENIAGAYFTESPVIDELVDAGGDPDSAVGDTGALVPPVDLAFSNPSGISQHSSYGSLWHRIYPAKYPATGPPAA